MSSWHWKVYGYAVVMWSEFLKKNTFEYERPKNLCAYIRMLTLYLPIVLLLNGAIYTSPFWVSALFVHWYGNWVLVEMFSFFGGIIAVVIALAVVGVGFVLIVSFLSTLPKVGKWLKDGVEKNLSKALLRVDKEDLPSFTRIILQHVSDRHSMFCRKINLVMPKETLE